ncbi:MAG: M20 family metallopeptidase [Lachnospiraceae bacterium]|nr:M20 family metallopeptidase [Lachnospiraceae bacterium]
MDTKIDFMKEAAALQEELTAWRRALHQIPETGLTLPKTMDFLTQKLDEMGISYQVYPDISCIQAVIGSGPRCFLLRSDVDGLPVAEEAEVPFKSVNGCMHGCGHDMHGTILLGAAKLLKAHESELKGTVKLLFQSGEEIFKGSKAAIDAGVLENPHVDAAFAAHVIGMAPVGLMMTGKKVMASVYGFKMTVTGRGGHGSMPEAAIDPINAAVQIYLALQSLIAREVPATEAAVLTIGQFSAGDVANVIPERAVLQGTLRTLSKEVREYLMKRISEIASAVAAAYRCQLEIEELSSCPSVITDDEVTASAEASIRALIPQMQIMKQMQGMGSEDFAEFTDRVPGAYYALGAGVPDQSKWRGQHNPAILFNEDVLQTGAAIYAKVAADWLEKHA